MDKRNFRDKSKKRNRRRVPSFRTHSHRRQFRSDRKSDSDDNNHETMIHKQLHGAGGSSENVAADETQSETRCFRTLQAKRKRCQDVQDDDDEDEATFGQQPAKHPRLSSCDSDNLAISRLTRAMANLAPVNPKPASSHGTDSRKRQYTSSCEWDREDDNYESSARIWQRHYNPDSNEGLVSDYSTGSRKHQFKSSRECDNDDYNHESIATIRHQLYGPGGPYDDLMAHPTESEQHCTKSLQVQHKDETLDETETEEETTDCQTAKKPKLDSSDLAGDLDNLKLHS